MVLIKQDTKKIKECGNNLIRLADSYNNKIERIFKKISILEKYWYGEDADRFLNGMKKENKIYLEHGITIKKYGNSLINFATKVEKNILNARKQ